MWVGFDVREVLGHALLERLIAAQGFLGHAVGLGILPDQLTGVEIGRIGGAATRP